MIVSDSADTSYCTGMAGVRMTAEIFIPPFVDVIFHPQVIDWTEHLAIEAGSVGSAGAAAVAPVVKNKPII